VPRKCLLCGSPRLYDVLEGKYPLCYKDYWLIMVPYDDDNFEDLFRYDPGEWDDIDFPMGA